MGPRSLLSIFGFPSLVIMLVCTLFLSQILLANSLRTKQPDMNDCLEMAENSICYHCDSSTDSYCEDPFKFSHYHQSKDIYLTECQGCCIKIVHPSINGTRRIQRSCTEFFPEVNFPLEPNCFWGNEDERVICLCNRGLCNAANVLSVTSIWLLPVFCTISIYILI